MRIHMLVNSPAISVQPVKHAVWNLLIKHVPDQNIDSTFALIVVSLIIPLINRNSVQKLVRFYKVIDNAPIFDFRNVPTLSPFDCFF